MNLTLYQIDAFAKKVFEGNPAAVCPLENWLDDALMQKIAMENNLSETAFFVQEGEKFHIRWFTPASEVDMCGHATLASAFVLFEILNYENEKDIVNAKPNFEELKKLDARGVIITAQSDTYDFVYRFFAPKYGIDEDPVTGSAFTQLVPYWNKVLNTDTFKTKQLSQRGGEVFCRLDGSRVMISGYGVKYLEGTISI